MVSGIDWFVSDTMGARSIANSSERFYLQCEKMDGASKKVNLFNLLGTSIYGFICSSQVFN